ncbi:MAG TPA: DEAD/DEAH box helicase [Desulfobulbus sp.]|nr:DEAD/DEAH box helicase [Desulfobulbus sp.]
MKNRQDADPGVPEPSVRLVVKHRCTMVGAPARLREAICDQLTIDNPRYLDAKRFGRWIGKDLKAKLRFFEQEDDTLVFPRGFANRAFLLCRELTGCDPEIIDRRRLLEENRFSFQGSLRPYQQEAVAAMLGRSFGVLEAGTGSGKTVMALKIIAERRQPAMVIVHSRELLHQWRERIAQFLDIEAGQVGDGRFELRPVTVAIVNSARNRIQGLPGHFGHIVVDECHRVPASLFTDVVSHFDCFYMLGLSATAFRREDGMTRLIYTYMGDRVHRVDPRLLTESGAVVRPRLIRKETGFTCRFGGDYPRLIKNLVRDGERNRQIAADVAALLDSGREGTVLLVSDRVLHCELLQRQLAALGVEGVLLTGRMPAELRAKVVERVRGGGVRVLISTLQLISEGFDCPGLSTLVLATPIKFEGRLQQVVGRIMRPARGKEALVLDYADVLVPVLRRSAEARQRFFDRWFMV